MKTTWICISFCALVLCSMGVQAAEKPAERPEKGLPELEVTGYGLGKDGTGFAYLKGIGLVGEGQVLEIKWQGDLYEVRIIAISREKVTTETRKVSSGEPEPVRRRVLPRDPFWPVGYQAWEVVEE